jgi:putative membrane-bound dehydrogenase-like protein
MRSIRRPHPLPEIRRMTPFRHGSSLIAFLGLASACVVAGFADEGIRPVDGAGKALNLDFEKGTLEDWTSVGDAFKDQPIEGDTVTSRRGDMKSGHQGRFWIGGFERHGDRPVGRLESAPFKVTHTFASFLVGGGPNDRTRVELVLKETGEVVFTTTGDEREDLERVVVDLFQHRGKEIFIRLVDQHPGHWGHLNFDDFRFHERRPQFPGRRRRPPPDVFQHAGLPGDEAARVMTVPKNFRVICAAKEPDVRQPIAMAFDARGRLWVLENFTYPRKSTAPMYVADPKSPPKLKGQDRILIFEDTDGDHTYDKRTVFFTGLEMVSGIELGFGGVYVGAAPYLLFIPDEDGDDKPDGAPQILLDGWGSEDTHETLNSFKWGPDGWLYGCHGIFTHSNVGAPGTPRDRRARINAGIWRFHPLRKTFEVYAHGTSNPWGVDFNDRGDCFLTCCVIPHLFHIIPGARYDRQAGAHFNPNTFADIKTIAKHRHYLGDTPHGGNGRSDAVGGGHAHAGCMIYRGGLWPKEYHGKIFMNNIHGARLNVDEVTPAGSGYVGDRNPDFLLTHDSSSQILNLQYGHDGNVVMIDWYDRQQCHTNNPGDHDQTNGRIFKIVYEVPGHKVPVVPSDLRKADTGDLRKLLGHANEWWVNQARRELMRRGEPADQPGPSGSADFAAMDEAARAGAVRAAAWDTPEAEISHAARALLLSAAADRSPRVRLAVASALNRGVGKRPEADRVLALAALKPLTAHAEDANDHNLPLLYWYALEPLVDTDPSAAMTLAAESPIPLLGRFAARKLGTIASESSLAVAVAVIRAAPVPQRRSMVEGLLQGLEGRRNLPAPAGWSELAADLGKTGSPEVRRLTGSLGVIFGDRAALAGMRSLLTDPKGTAADRAKALETLLDGKDGELAGLLPALLDDGALRGPALRAAASFDQAALAERIIKLYPSLTPAEKRDALSTLAARKSYATPLLAAVKAKTIPAADISADLVRQLRNLGDRKIDRLVADSWGVVRDSPADKAKLITDWRLILESKPGSSAAAKVAKAIPNALPQDGPADIHLGRAIFQKTCAQCHRLFGEGGAVGPEITGANRGDLGYLLSNVLDSSAVMAKEYQPTLFSMTDGRVVTGIVKGETPAAVTVATANETVTLAKGDIESRRVSEKSMMPDDLLKGLTVAEVRGLFLYLAAPAQRPELATKDNAAGLFNGKDLTGWWVEKPSEAAGGDGVKFANWSVENGEIVGRTKTGLKRNEFLKSKLLVRDFRLSLEVKLEPNTENSGIQIRSAPIEGGEMRGCQVDMGKGWWGKLYEESARGLLVPPAKKDSKTVAATDAYDPATGKWIGEDFVKPGQWNRYEIEAIGDRIVTRLNGRTCSDITDPAIAREGLIAVQIHSGGPTEVRFRNLKLEVVPNR